MALFDQLKKQQTPSPPEQETLASILRAKSGKAVGAGTGPKASDIARQAGLQQTQAAQTQLAQQQQVNQQQLKQTELGQKQQQQQQFAQLESNLADIQQRARLQANQTLSEFERGKGELKSKQNLAKLDQLGFDLALQNDRYIYDLQDAGRRARLDDELSFKKQLQTNFWADQIELFNLETDFDTVLSDRENEYRESLSKSSINFDVLMRDYEFTAANRAAIWQSVGNLVTAGTAGYASYKKSEGGE